MRQKIFALITFTLGVVSAVHADDSAPLEKYVGKIRTGRLAIGGETTGAQFLEKNGRTFEARRTDGKSLRPWNGKSVQVQGRVEERRGVEIRRRQILAIETIDALNP